MSSIIGNPLDVLNTIKLCDQGKEAEAMKMHNLQLNKDVPEGSNIIDRMVAVANSTDNTNDKLGGVLVAKSEKTGDVAGAVEDVVTDLKDASDDMVAESISTMVTGVNFFVDHAKTFKALAEDFDTDDVVGSYGDMDPRALPVANPKSLDDIQKMQDMQQNDADAQANSEPNNYYGADTTDKGLKDTVSSWMETAKNALKDVAFRSTDLFKYIQDHWMEAGALTAVGVLICYLAYKMWKKNPKTTVDDIKNISTKLPDEVTNESANAFYSLVLEDDSIELNGNNSLQPIGTVENPGFGLGAIKAADNLATQQRAANGTEGQSSLGKFGQSISDFFTSLPGMVKDAMNDLSQMIQGKQLYIGLIVSAIVAATAIYAIYKLRGKKKDVKTEEGVAAASVEESRNAMINFSGFFKKAISLLEDDSAVDSDKHSFYSKYIDSAVDAGNKLFSDSDFKNSKMYDVAEKAVAKMAAPYDEYMQDLAA